MKIATNSLTAATIFAALFSLTACGSKESSAPPAAGGGMPPPEVDVITVATGSVALTQDLPGRLEAYRSAQIRARVDGIIEKRLFIEGSDVKAGEKLYQIDARNYQAAYDSTQADVGVARQTVARYKSLLAVSAVNQQDYDLTVAKLKQAESAMSRAKLDLENTHVPAPIAGRIGRTQVTEGALVGHGEATLLATIEQVNPIYVNFTQSGVDVLHMRQAIKSGKLKRADAKVELVLEDGNVYPLAGQMLFTNLAVDPSTGSVLLRAKFPNPEQDLLPGMFARVRFAEGIADNSIRVPQRAVMTSAQGQSVLVVDAQGKVEPRPVKTGNMVGGDFIITEGMEPGTQVIVNGVQKVRPGAQVKAVPWNPQGAANAASAPAATDKK